MALDQGFDSAAERSQLVFESALNVFLEQGGFRVENAIDKLRQRGESLREKGFAGVRIIVEMTWVFEVALGAQRIAEYSSRIDALLTELNMTMLCQYDPQFFKPAFLLDLLSSYRQVLVDQDIHQNFYYVPPSHTLLEQHQAAVFHQSIETLRALGRAEALLNQRSAELKQSTDDLEMLHSIIDSMGDAVFVVDEKGDMLYCNKSSQAILGYGFVDLPIEDRVRKIGNFLPDMVTPYPVKELPIARAIRGEASDGVIVFIKNDQRPGGVWISSNGRPLRDRHGNIKGGLVVSRDITQQKRAQDEKERLEEQMFRTQKLESLGVLAGGIAHDFNNLLMGVLGNADLALRTPSTPKPVRDRVTQVAIAARRLSDLTHQLLAYSGQGPFAQEQLDLSDLVREMGELLRPAISKRATVEYDFEDELPRITADPTQIRQVVMNLITNASDAIGDQQGTIAIRTGEIELSTEDLRRMYLADDSQPGSYVYLDISDTGCGMDEQTLAKIFDPFFTTKFTGRGLGLAAVLGIVRRHNGGLQVQSTLGRGTRFRVLFPALESIQPPIANDEKYLEEWSGAGKVLVVDDEQTVRDIASEMLRHLGFDPVTAATGKHALKLFRENSANLKAVILDLTMPDMDGEQILSSMRQHDGDTRFIVSSGYHESNAVDRIGRDVIRGYLQKPYGHEQLSRVLQTALR